ncbi:ABC-2 family transporter protein [Posidoniimonas corsicana]|uniref:ABC-2 family transporter protein n=1 Tax=Posidoniimonas corsicana TaxID=1938618 RepID=A0A5C5VF09_9BACT|nr:hypothetical protein [Posidoniimonas corsicana]TWT37236.1 ABC-2 family transporter protein [Posidoniimonas corsicana]
MNAGTYPTAPAAPETLRLAKRFLWKECRMLSGLALGVAAVACLVMAAAWLFVPRSSTAEAMLAIAFSAAALFAVAAAVTLFSVEREEGTAALIEWLPRNAPAVFAGKVVAGIAMTLTVLTTLAACGWLASGVRWPSDPLAGMIASQGAIAILEAFVWGLLASLLIRNPLLAAVAAIAAASLSGQAAMLLTVENAKGFTLHDYQAAIPGRLVLVLLAAGLDAWLGLRWLDQPKTARVRGRTKAADRATTRPPRSGMLTRLVWQTHRESWKTALAAALIGVALSGCFALAVAFSADAGWLAMLCPLFTPALFGALAFRADQRRHSYRFLAEHAGRPWGVWLSRQVVWLGYLTLLLVVAAEALWVAVWRNLPELGRLDLWRFRMSGGDLNPLAIAAEQMEQAQVLEVASQLFFTALVGVYVAYAVGQLFSLLVRSEILAGMLALGASMLVVAYAALVGGWRLSPVWFLAPIGLGALLATLLRIKDWMFERPGLWRWAAPAAAVVLPAVAVLAGIPGERSQQLSPRYFTSNLPGSSEVVHGTSTVNTLLPTMASKAAARRERGREVGDDYMRLAEEVTTGAKPIDEWLPEFIKLSKVDCRAPSEGLRRFSWDGALSGLIPAALASESNDRLEVLLACRRANVQRTSQTTYNDFLQTLRGTFETSRAIVDWAAAQQESEPVLDALNQIRQVDSPLSDPAEPALDVYLDAQAVIRGKEAPTFLRGKDASPSLFQWATYVLNALPSEAARAERALNLMAIKDIDFLSGCRMAAHPTAGARPRATLDRVLQSYWAPESLLLLETEALGNDEIRSGRPPHNYRLLSLAKTSALAANEYGLNPHRWVRAWMMGESYRRAELVRLALIAYRIDQGAYPESLAELAPEYLAPDGLINPLSNDLYGYEPQGFDLIAWDAVTAGGRQLIPQRTPLLWSAGVVPNAAGSGRPTEGELHFEIDAEGQLVAATELGPDEAEEGQTIDTRPTMMLPNHDDLLPYSVGGGFWMPLPADLDTAKEVAE